MLMRRMTVIGAALVLLVAACGGGDDDATEGGAGERTVEIDMVDIAFEPDTLQVERGETVRFTFANRGKVAHDAFIGDEEAQAEHEQEMGDDHGGEHGDGDEDAVTVDPGEDGELTYTFDESGTFEIGCHQPGHYDAGMKVTVEVS